MKNVKIITRADDAGSSRSANNAIARAINVGFIKNVSLMAPGEFIDEAAALFADNKNICFGLHATLNAEWDRVKWKPLTNLDTDSGLVDENGYFWPVTAIFKETKPRVETVLREYDAQLDMLTKLGFAVNYVDSHMFAEYFIEGLPEAKREWANKKGLLHHMDYTNGAKGAHLEENLLNLGKFFSNLPDGQYLYVVHPALYSEEMLETGTAEMPGCEVARVRSLEAEVVADPEMLKFMLENGVSVIRYDEAEKV
ncbi:MAG: ChbG/HpnK family deacetylase [Firmicutes bacterium]|nr:ChbG/HpnK family deacetylase [Bacillota bacterium]